jgi:hypothetical protein
MGMKYRTAQEAINSIKSGQRVFMQGSAATPSILLKSLFERKGELKNVELVSISTLGNVVFNSKELGESFFINSLFVSDSVREMVSLTCIKSTPSRFLPVFFIPPSPQYLSRGVCSLRIRLPVANNFYNSSGFCPNLARRPFNITPYLISGQSSGLCIFSLRPRAFAFFGFSAFITSSYNGVPMNFWDWKKCSLVGYVLPSILKMAS